MGKLLDVVASQLRIRSSNKGRSISECGIALNTTNQGYIYKDVPEDTRVLFKKAFHQHMYRKLKTIKVGEAVDYMFDCGKYRPLSLLMDDGNKNLAEVLQKLPALPEGESYAFPPNSYVSIALRAKHGKTFKIKVNAASDVFIEAGL